MVTNQQSAFLMKIRNVISSAGVPLAFSPEAVRESSEIESEFKWPFIGKRTDLRGKTTFTLGSEEVAFSVEREGEDFILGIHSVDVANLFPLSSALDEEAFNKGRSVLFPGKTYSMLPEAISSGFCSLKEGEESFTVSVFLKTNQEGKVRSVNFAESVIKVTANCEPKEVEALLFNIDVSCVGFLRYKYHSVLKQLEDMFLAGANLKMARENRGAEDVDTAVRSFSRKGIRGDVVNVCFEKLSDPERLVREIISAAGIEIAKFLHKKNIPCPYRHRALMSSEGNKELRNFLESVFINTASVSDKDIVSFAVDKAHGGRNEELILSKIKELLPSSACSSEPLYHGGLASKYYVRFAYPVSRYSDLCLQRIIKAVVACGGDLSSLDHSYISRCVERAVVSVTQNEPKAKRIENHVSDLYAIEFLKNNKNKLYEGTVWNVYENKVEICLDNSCKGFLLRSSEMVVGQRLTVKVVEADFETEKVIFEKV